MKCPHCGSKRTQVTNATQRFLGLTTTTLVYFVSRPVMGENAQGPAKTAGREVCPYVNYICLDCKKEFSEKFM